jgi:hypothetical protein
MTDAQCVRELLIAHGWNEAKVAQVLIAQYEDDPMRQAQQRCAPFAISERAAKRIARRACGKALRTIRLAKRTKWFATVGKNDLGLVKNWLARPLQNIES